LPNVITQDFPMRSATPEETRIPDGRKDLSAPLAHVDLRNIGLVYGDGNKRTPAIDGLTLQVKRGEFVAVVGPSGSGKSTLMKLVTGLMLPDSGEAYYDGKRITAPVKDVGMAFQNATLLPWRTTLDNVMLPFEIVEPHKHRLRRNREDYIGRAQRLLAKVGLLEFADKHPGELSGGMQQRANVCRALVHEPKLLMLDEPFGALDAFTREELWGVTQGLWMAQGFSTILVTHDLREAVFLADRVVVLSSRPGRVILEQKVDFPRPRDISTIYTPEFGEIVKTLRSTIMEARR
jgi:NitT/TauT family transport system ATP-binding protein